MSCPVYALTIINPLATIRDLHGRKHDALLSANRRCWPHYSNMVAENRRVLVQIRRTGLNKYVICGASYMWIPNKNYINISITISFPSYMQRGRRNMAAGAQRASLLSVRGGRINNPKSTQNTNPRSCFLTQVTLADAAAVFGASHERDGVIRHIRDGTCSNTLNSRSILYGSLYPGLLDSCDSQPI